MLEAKQGFATLEDVDQGTMVRFIEWLYRGYYHAAHWCLNTKLRKLRMVKGGESPKPAE